MNHRTTIGQVHRQTQRLAQPAANGADRQRGADQRRAAGPSTGQYNNGTYYPSLIEIQQGKWSNTDWADLCMRTAVVNNTTATLSHSTDKAAINLSLNYFDDEGVYKKDNFRKGNVTLNGSYKLAKNFTLQTSNILSIHKRHVNNTLEYGRNPLWPVYDEDGNYFVASETDFGHPLIISDNVKNETQGRDLISSLAAEWGDRRGIEDPHAAQLQLFDLRAGCLQRFEHFAGSARHERYRANEQFPVAGCAERDLCYFSADFLPTGTTCRSWRDTPSTTTWAGRSALRPMIS